MERISTVSTKVAWGLLVALAALNVYQAARLSITPDEAYAFVHFVQPPVRQLLRPYDPLNQVLNTLLVKRTVGLLRPSEFSVRLPALLAIGFYFWAVYRVSRRLFGSGLKFLLAVSILVLNPWVQDHLWAAGGDAIALALWMWGLEKLISGKPRDFNVAGLLLGLSVAASTAFVLPAVVLVIGWLILSRPRWAFIERCLLTAMTAAFILLSIPWSRAEAKPFDFHLRFHTRTPQESGVRAWVATLRAQAGNQPRRIAVSPELLPSLEFYRARYRLRMWTLVSSP